MSEAKPQIIIPDLAGYHNSNIEATKKRIEKSKSYQDLSTICIIPCFNQLPTKAVQSWMSMLTPMNQKFFRIWAMNMEVGQAYSETIEMILSNPQLSEFRFVMTLEHDNIIPPDALIKLYEHTDKYDAVGAIYFTKGEGGQPMIYGDVTKPLNFIPFMPQQEIQPCHGLGMGCTLFKMKMLKDSRLRKPLFRTVQNYREGVGVQQYTQDLRFFEDAGRIGYKFACDTRVRVGHFDLESDFTW